MLSFAIKIFVLSLFECPLETGFTVYSSESWKLIRMGQTLYDKESRKTDFFASRPILHSLSAIVILTERKLQ